MSWVVWISLFLFSFFQADGFKDEQLRYPRVRQAYNEVGEGVKKMVREKDLKMDSLRLYIRAFKFEKRLEVWGRNLGGGPFIHLQDISICKGSGSFGPKREQGDEQVPEGFYHIDRFNPASRFHLSLGLNYPNPSDKVLGKEGNLGGNIFIHGNCVTIGCIPITDPLIQELYILCVEARNAGQRKIPVTIFPVEPDSMKFHILTHYSQGEESLLELWGPLARAYRIFERTREAPRVTFNSNGTHDVH